MSHLPLSRMNGLNKTESAVFKLWMLYFQRIIFNRQLRDHNSCRCSCVAVLKSLPVHRYIVISHFLVLWDCKVQHLPVFESRVALNSGLGGVRNVASVIISHEQTKKNRVATVCCFQALHSVFPNDPLYR